MFSNFKIVRYSDRLQRMQDVLPETVRREEAIHSARREIDADPTLLMVEVWAEWDAGSGPRTLRIYSETNWR